MVCLDSGLLDGGWTNRKSLQEYSHSRLEKAGLMHGLGDRPQKLPYKIR
ncbi:MAG: hypothetical protein SNJ57_01475 [Cyanobacteriota bacterium]